MQTDAETQAYFDSIQKEVERAYSLAKQAREKGKDPQKYVEIPLAEDLAARVEGLVSTYFPSLLGSGLASAIRVFEEKYGKNDERVALLIGKDVALGKFTDFGTPEKFADAGLRVAVAYLTLGVVTAPLEGIASVRIKQNDDGTKYLAVYFAGPIRSAGGTASAISVLAADFIRKALNLDGYKPSEIETNRYYTEVEDYYNRVAAKQYHPTKEEMDFIIKNVPVEITGDPTEEIEVSNYKDLPRVETNKIRGGMCLILLDGIPLKAEKVLGRVKKYPPEYGLQNWLWLDEFVKLKNRIHAVKKPELKDNDSKVQEKYTPKDTYLSKVLAGRPILSHPGRAGGFRLRYGRSRTGGLAATSIHPATMYLTEFVAVGTQIATELPGKATVCTPCDSIEPPVVKLKDGSVAELVTKEDVQKYKSSVVSILSMGDILIPYGEFASNNHILMPAAYCEEWWIQELERALNAALPSAPNNSDSNNSSNNSDTNSDTNKGVRPECQKYIKYAKDIKAVPDLSEAFAIAKEMNIPLHPRYNFFWHDISPADIRALIEWFSKAESEQGAAGASGECGAIAKITLKESGEKGILEKLCVMHKVQGDSIVLEGRALSCFYSLGCPRPENKGALIQSISDGTLSPNAAVSKLSGVKIRERGLSRVGLKMGRPEKAEKRLLKGRPQILFPCGNEGGKMRNLMVSYSLDKVDADFPVFKCPSCGKESIYPKCSSCGKDAELFRSCASCGRTSKDQLQCCGQPTKPYKRRILNLKAMMDAAFKNVGLIELPKLFKGVRGVSGPERSMEFIEKGVLRTKYELFVNKDGTTRYDSSDVSMTHFKPKEVGVSVEKLRSLGYLADIRGKPLENDNQVLDLKVQDIVISDNSDFSSVEYLINVSRFVDELLIKFYGTEPFYNIKTREDLVGQLVIGLAPHTSAGIIGRIVGFTPAKVCFAHPFWHAGKRRNCDGDEDSFMLLMDALLNFSRKFLPDTRGGRSVAEDTIIYCVDENEINALTARELIDGQILNFGAKIEGGFEICRANPKKIEAICFDPITRSVGRAPITAFIRHTTDRKMYEIKTTGGEIKVTEDHSLFVTRGADISVIRTSELRNGDCIVGFSNLSLEQVPQLKRIDFFELLDPEEIHLVVPKEELAKIRMLWANKPHQLKKEIAQKWDVCRYLSGNRAAPLAFYKKIGITPTNCKVNLGHGSAVRMIFDADNRLFALIGYMLSEGDNINGELTNTNPAIVEDMQNCLEHACGFKPEVREDKRKAKICYRIRIPKVLLAALYKLGIKPEKARQKTIPPFVFNASYENKKAFLNAYVKGDGHVYKGKNFTKIYTSSIVMAAQMSLLLHILGYKTTCHKTRPNMYELLFSELNETDPWWPLWDMTKELYRGLRAAGLKKQQISRILANYRKNSRTKTASKQGIEKLQEIITDVILQNRLKQIHDSDIKAERVISIKEVQYAGKYVYDLEVPKHQNFLCGPHPLFVHNTMDAPLVLTSKLNPEEVDDEAWKVDILASYPLEFYEDTMKFKTISELTKKPRVVADVIKTPEVFHIKFTHDTDNVNDGPKKTKYVELGSMNDKVIAQLDIAKKAVAVDTDKVAELVISKHFLRDIKGNLRTFSTQQFRCKECNTKYRRVPLIGKCKCGGKLQLSVSEGAVRKYLEPTKHLAENYRISPYLRQQFGLVEADVDGLFGKKARQLDLSKFNGK